MLQARMVLMLDGNSVIYLRQLLGHPVAKIGLKFQRGLDKKKKENQQPLTLTDPDFKPATK